MTHAAGRQSTAKGRTVDFILLAVLGTVVLMVLKMFNPSDPAQLESTSSPTPTPAPTRAQEAARAETAARGLTDLLEATLEPGGGQSHIVRGSADGLDYRVRVRARDVEVRVHPERPIDDMHLNVRDGPPGDPLTLSWLPMEVRESVSRLAVGGASTHIDDNVVLTRSKRRSLSRSQLLVERTVRLASLLQHAGTTRGARLAAGYRQERQPNWKLGFANAILDAHEMGEPSPAMTDLLGDRDLHVRARTAAFLHDVPTLTEVAAHSKTPVETLGLVLSSVRGREGFASVACAACAGGALLSDPDLVWVLQAAIAAPSPDLEPVLLHALDHSSGHLQRSALDALGEVGTVAAIPSLRAVTERWAQPRRVSLATKAVSAIRARAGVEEGGVSLAATSEEAGAVSVADPHRAGRLSESDRQEGGR